MLRSKTVITATIAAATALLGLTAQAQLVSPAPVDFEACADLAERAATRQAQASALTECNAKFAGRRKPGGGYSYYDFMQNRSFDIAGPNPTPQEQKYIDQQYTDFLDAPRQDRATAVSAVNQAAEPPPRLAPPYLPPRQANLSNDKVPLPLPRKPAAATAAADAKSRAKAAACAEHSFSCDWPLLSDGLRRLFGASQATDQTQNQANNQAKNQVKDPARKQAKVQSKNQVNSQANNQVNGEVKDKGSAIDGRSPM